MKTIIAIIITLFSVQSYALTTEDFNRAGFANLSTAQQADILKTIATTAEQAKQANSLPPVPSVEDVEKYADIGTNIAKALGTAAKELNVGINEFISTPAGIIATGLIIYKVLGQDVLNQIHSIFEAFAFSIIWVSYLIWFIRRVGDIKITYSDKVNWLGKQKIETYYREALSSEHAWLISIGVAICSAITVTLL